MKHRTKRDSQERHAQRRFAERHLMEVSRRDLDAMVATIKAGRAHLVRRQSLRVGVYDLDFEGRRVRVVYDRQRAAIVTTLPTSNV